MPLFYLSIISYNSNNKVETARKVPLVLYCLIIADSVLLFTIFYECHFFQEMEAIAEHDFNATAEDELSFRKSQILKVFSFFKFSFKILFNIS